MRFRRTAFALLFVALAPLNFLACGSECRIDDPPPDAVVMVDGGADGSADRPAERPAEGGAPAVRLGTPRTAEQVREPAEVAVEVVPQGPGSPGEFVVRSSRLSVLYEGSSWYEWTAEVENVGKEAACFLEAKADLHGEGDALLASFETYVHAKPHRSSYVRFTVPCLAPGESGWLSTIKGVRGTAELGAARRLVVRFEPSDGTPGPAVEIPITATSFDPGPVAVLAGELQAPEAFEEVSLMGYALDDGGFVVGRVSATHRAPLAAGERWSYRLPFSSLDRAPAAFVVVPSFWSPSEPLPPADGAAAAKLLSARRRYEAMVSSGR